jgi:hypothetical protein
MGWACGTYRGQEGCIQGLGGKNLRKRKHLENIGGDGSTILN